jgi:hypothetical protein
MVGGVLRRSTWYSGRSTAKGAFRTAEARETRPKNRGGSRLVEVRAILLNYGFPNGLGSISHGILALHGDLRGNEENG